MAGNLQALIRYRTIDRCMHRRHQCWSWQELSKACGEELRNMLGQEQDDPSRRTIFNDIRNMKNGLLGYEAPIAFDRQRRSFYYSDPDFSIFKIPLSREDSEELKHALIILRQFRGFRHFQGIENIIAQLEHNVQREEHPERQLIDFDHSADSPGQQWLDELYRHTYNAQVMHITYHPFDFEEPYTHPISPYLLKEYNRRWFLVGYNHQRGRIENMALDRIVQLKTSGLSFHMSPNFNEQTYFRNLIGVTIPADATVQEVRFRVSPQQAPYLITKPLHASQEVLEKNEAGWLFRLQLIPNYELQSKLLSFGERVEVLAPAALRDRIKERVRAMGRWYD